MSTDRAGGAAGDARLERQRAGFRRLSLGVIVALALVAGGLGAVNAAQGPRLSSTELNPQALVTRAGQRVVLHADQPLAELSAAALTISPATDATVSVDQGTATIRFGRMLDYATRYTIRLEVRGAATGTGAALEFSFTTPDVEVYSLLRHDPDAPGEPDRILRSGLADAGSGGTVFEAPRIQDYVALRELLAVITLDERDVPALTVISPAEGVRVPIDVGGAATVRELHAAGTGDLFGYILDAGYGAPDGPRNTLFLYDLTDATGVPAPVTGFGGAPLEVMSWTFVPGTTSIVAQGLDQQLYLIDPLGGGDPTPLGQHVGMQGFVPGTTQLVVVDPTGSSVIDLADGSTTPLELPEPKPQSDRYPGKRVPLDERTDVQLFTRLEPGAPSEERSSSLVLSDADGERELFRTSSPGSWVRDFCLSPNGEYLAVEVVSGEGRPDNYPIEYGFSATSIRFVRIADGSSDRGVRGFLPDWCR
ncbi:hypothetical protein [Protaetiibacter larvae]|uniref:SbsA Ig-like domain-containing protein n=1 Tax=Protaetiibacter larvae TaxID=2592654 RepID=A0A5C1Y4H1_9MICO|nr:hypothetical protein [Protaetiibacter larvae]QEO08923.1 hypothetical protein FLP23_02140 [Protaetiibacter larvae]